MDLGLIIGIGAQLINVIGNAARNAQAVQAEAELQALQAQAAQKTADIQRLQSEVQSMQSRLSSIANSIQTSSIAQYAPYIALLAGAAVGWVVIK